MPELCVVCHAEPGRVCPTCQHHIAEQLAALPRRYAAVARELAPGRTAQAERVTASAHVHAALPARTDVLSLVGPGGDVPATLHPLVRHWSAKRKVLVTTHVVGHARTVEVEVTDWFHELVLGDDGKPVMVPDDDQVGTVPPREWLDMQVRRWRSCFGHHVPARTLLGGITPYVPAAWRLLLRYPNGPTIVALLAAAHEARGGQARLAYRGLLSEPTAQQLPDPVVAELERRGEPPHTMRWDIDYLRTWLSKACEQPDLDIATFAAQLSNLHAELARALNDTPDETWVGRCPAFITELGDDGEPTGRKRPCGAGLWQDNGAFSAQVRCPRCHITWDTRGHAGVGTAREIRRVWPVDRRQRYTADKIDRLTIPKCPTCGKRVRISWRDVTGTHDKQRTWQPTGATCPNGCDEARRVL